VDCNQFYVTLEKYPHEPAFSFPLSRVEINFDNLRKRMQLEIIDRNRNEWEVQLDRHVRHVVGQTMTLEGRMLLKHLLLQGTIDNGRQFMNEISMDVQNKQIQIAINHQIVIAEQESTGLRRAYFQINPQYRKVLERVLPDLLR